MSRYYVYRYGSNGFNQQLDAELADEVDEKERDLDDRVNVVSDDTGIDCWDQLPFEDQMAMLENYSNKE